MISAALVSQLKEHEGLRLKPYKCTEGYLTIGYGRNLDSNGITQLEAELLLMTDISNSIKELDDMFPWYKAMSEQRRNVLVDMHFNLGTTKLLKFQKFIDFCVAGDFYSASMEMLHSKWAKQVGLRAVKLSAMMREG